MKTVKLSPSDSETIAKAVKQLAENKPIERSAKKAIDASKVIVAKELESLRGIVLEQLPEGETVIVQFDGNGGLKIDRKGSDRFDLESARVADPEFVKRFTRRGIATYFEPLS